MSSSEKTWHVTRDKAICICRRDFKSPDSSSDREGRGERNPGLRGRPLARQEGPGDHAACLDRLGESPSPTGPQVSTWHRSVLVPRRRWYHHVKKTETSTLKYKIKIK